MFGPIRIVFACVVVSGVVPVDALAAGQGKQPPVSLYGVLPSEPGAKGNSAADAATPAAVTKPPSRGEFLLAPLPMINPTLENGLIVMTGYLYRLDPNDAETPPSASGLAGFKTSNGSWGTAIIQKLHPANDRFRFFGVAAYADVNYPFYGIGNDAGDAAESVQVNQAGSVGIVDGLIRVAPNWYAGARYQWLKMNVNPSEANEALEPIVPEGDRTLRTAAVGPRVDFDSRDSDFFPRRGTQIQGIANFYSDAFGGRRTYQQYQASINRYHSLNPRHVVAWRAIGCGTVGSAPFYDLCLLGKPMDLRGYTLGQYRDHALLSVQAEWRSELWWRFGAAVFAGAGAVAPDFGDFAWKDTLPSGGVGLRFVLAKKNHVNLRMDYAWGKNSSAFYMSVGEVF